MILDIVRNHRILKYAVFSDSWDNKGRRYNWTLLYGKNSINEWDDKFYGLCIVGKYLSSKRHHKYVRDSALNIDDLRELVKEAPIIVEDMNNLGFIGITEKDLFVYPLKH